ncbi:putative adhesin [Jatrophihabitans sp. GAS493]|uniref:DUF4097 family beta strand repeat-containing protein n=1 Tax=Jatrophihabitans sp. GAS493 TaxID=1907575 RepID=UPI000BB9ACFF|nr:DUF4097 family beta strand repeat-containing protein [Jatrophihabitans sp. GAS493]SOD70331.1 putative adhesin [Jatrophihabitans sp. GAS493]
MPSYETPQPISVTLELSVGNVRITASERTDSVIEVRPTDPADDSDVKAAQQVRVDYTNGTLRVTGPKSKVFDFSHRSKSVDVTIGIPSDSHLSATMQVGDLHCAGRLGECSYKTSVGNLWSQQSAALRIQTSIGDVSADEIAGDAEIATGSGRVQLGQVDGAAEVKNSNGDTELDAVTGDVRVRSANGSIRVDRAGAGVDAKTSNGDIRVGEVVGGSVVLATAKGDLDVGVAEGTAAWLQLNTAFGHVRNLLDPAAQPGDSDQRVEVHGRTSYGDITVRRAPSQSGRVNHDQS